MRPMGFARDAPMGHIYCTRPSNERKNPQKSPELFFLLLLAAPLRRYFRHENPSRIPRHLFQWDTRSSHKSTTATTATTVLHLGLLDGIPSNWLTSCHFLRLKCVAVLNESSWNVNGWLGLQSTNCYLIRIEVKSTAKWNRKAVDISD